jgi:hypothetical protein
MAYLQEKPKLTIETFTEKRKTQYSSKSTISLQQLLDECSSRATLSPGGSLQIPKRSSSKDYSAVLLKSDPIVLDKPLPMAPSRTKSIKTSSWIHDILKSTDISENEAGSKEVEVVALTPVAASAGFECAETLMLPNLKEVEEPAPTSSSLLSESSPNTSNAQDASTTAAWVSSLMDFSASPISPKFGPSGKTDDTDGFLKPVVSIYSLKTIAMLNPGSPTSDDKRNSDSLTDEGDKTIVSSPNLEMLLMDQHPKEVEKTQSEHVLSESDLPEIPKAHSKTLPRAKAIKPQQQQLGIQPPKILPRTSSLDPEVKAEAHHKLQYNTYRRYLRDQQKRVEIPVEFK